MSRMLRCESSAPNARHPPIGRRHVPPSPAKGSVKRSAAGIQKHCTEFPWSSHTMREMEISKQELSRLTEDALALVTSYWASVEARPAYPATSGEETAKLFSRQWREEGLGRDVLREFK